MKPWEYKDNKNIAKEEVKKEEVKTESKEETKSTQPLVITSAVDAHIYQRIQSQPKTLEDIKIKDVSHSGNHQLILPEVVKQLLEKKGLVARWINKDKRMIDRAIDIRGWTLFNLVYFPELNKHKYLFTANGTIENGDAILGFMPLKQAEMLRAAPREISTERVKNLPIEKWKTQDHPDAKVGYYQPTLSAEKDGEEVTVGIQPDVQVQNQN